MKVHSTIDLDRDTGGERQIAARQIGNRPSHILGSPPTIDGREAFVRAPPIPPVPPVTAATLRAKRGSIFVYRCRSVFVLMSGNCLLKNGWRVAFCGGHTPCLEQKTSALNQRLFNAIVQYFSGRYRLLF
jgi:hypothetical protein